MVLWLIVEVSFSRPVAEPFVLMVEYLVLVWIPLTNTGSVNTFLSRRSSLSELLIFHMIVGLLVV